MTKKPAKRMVEKNIRNMESKEPKMEKILLGIKELDNIYDLCAQKIISMLKVSGGKTTNVS